MYKLLISTKAQKALKQLRKVHQEAILNALEEIKEEPFIGKPLTRELTGRFAFRVGLYRIIYKINRKNRIVRVLGAGHRRDIYE